MSLTSLSAEQRDKIAKAVGLLEEVGNALEQERDAINEKETLDDVDEERVSALEDDISAIDSALSAL